MWAKPGNSRYRRALHRMTPSGLFEMDQLKSWHYHP